MEWLFKVNGKRYFTIGAQVRNSGSLSEEDMENNWKQAEKIGLNTLAASVHWDLFEREEGIYDYRQIDMLLAGARRHKMHLILLWFGAWKNGVSSYIPGWMKKDTEKYCRAETLLHQKLMVLSPLCRETSAAESRAFLKMVSHIKEENKDGTILGIQIENEPGLLGAARDYSRQGEAYYRSGVPDAVLQWLFQSKNTGDPVVQIWIQNGEKNSGSWKELFGGDAAEICMAAAFAQYINRLARAGKMLYDISFYVNVWLGEIDYRIPGRDYPSGGAVSKVFGLWKFLTPYVDALSPDIYYKDTDTYREIVRVYAKGNNPLYIPETGCSVLSAVNSVHGIAAFGLSGVHCFGLEQMFDGNGEIREECLEFCHLIRTMRESLFLLEKYQGTPALYEVTQKEGQGAAYYDFGDFIGRVIFTNPLGDDYFDGKHLYMDAAHTEEECYRVRGKGFIVYEGDGRFYLAGEGFRLNLIRKKTVEQMTNGMCLSDFYNLRQQEYLEVSEGFLDLKGGWHEKRKRTGDETDYGIWVHYDVGIVRVLMNL